MMRRHAKDTESDDSVINAQLRPLLWGARFCQASYAKNETVKVVAGSMLGDVLIWTPDISKMYRDSSNANAMTAIGQIERLAGHQGSIYNVVYSPSGNLLASVSDDRTVKIWSSHDRTTRTADDGVAERDPMMSMWGHEGRIWRVEWIDDTRLATCGEVRQSGTVFESSHSC